MNRRISIDENYCVHKKNKDVNARIRDVLKSTAFKYIENESAFYFAGPDTSYYELDPMLEAGIRKIAPEIGITDAPFFWRHMRNYDFCMEDSWSGYLISKRWSEIAPNQDLILIHLDDHTDMMPTLLVRDNGVLFNPSSGALFELGSEADWEEAIVTGVISIGSFISALYYCDRNIHICHIDNKLGMGTLEYVAPVALTYPLIPGFEFASIEKRGAPDEETKGTYLRSGDPMDAIRNLNRGWVIVHIDLDYFINDFNGNPGTRPLNLTASQYDEVMVRMDRFFAALMAESVPVSHWIIAASPGFCAAQHWQRLLTELDVRIETFVSTRS